MNDVMVYLLTFRTSIDAHWQRLISELEIAHCQNETKASDAINGVEATTQWHSTILRLSKQLP